MRWMLVSMVAATAACGSSKQASDDNAAKGSAKTAVEAPMPIAFGDCGDGPFVSGPRPLSLAPMDDPPPPPEEDKPDDGKDNSGGTGTAMALDEGKMGRPAGQYHMKGPDGDAALARQQAIDAARAAGILGSSALHQGGENDEPTVFSGLEGTRANLASAGNSHSFGLLGDAGPYAGHDSPLGSNPGGPRVAIGAVRDQTSSDKDMIRRYIHRNISKVTYCYEKQLLVKPTLAGTVTAKFFITPTGTVTNATASGVDPAVSSCIAKFVGELKFAKPGGGGGIQVSYPFTLRPAGNDRTPATGSGSAPAAGSGSAPATGSGSAAVDSGSAAAPPTHARALTLFRTGDDDAPPYVPGHDNPLRAEQAALAKCLRANPKPYGVAVVELAGPTSKVFGIEDGMVQACVLEVGKRVVRLDKPRCSFSFGVMPVSALPAIDIAGTDVSFAGKLLVIRVVNAPAEAVTDAIRPTITAALAPSGTAVVAHGPIVIRATDKTTFVTLTRVLAGVLAAGDDFVLASQRGSDWQLVDPVDLPVVPVPLGSGGRWNRVMGMHADDLLREDAKPRLSVMIEYDAIWVGVSGVEDYTTIPRDAAQWTKLAAALKEKKASAPFAGRTDIELAADDNVIYGDLVKAIDSAKQAGFTGWQLTDPPGLSAHPKR